MQRDDTEAARTAFGRDRDASFSRSSRRVGSWHRLVAPLSAAAAIGVLVAACTSGPPNAAGVASIGTTIAPSSGAGHAGSGSGSGLTGSGSGSGATDSGSNGGPGGQSGGGGGGQSAGGPQIRGSISIGGGSAKALAFAKCMRANGVPNFPDPSGNGTITFHGIDASSPAFQQAQRKCGPIGGGQPPSPAQQQQMMAQALKFSRCMRAHGISQFPDPQVGPGGAGIAIRIRAGSSSDLNPNNPLFQAAQQACAGLLPGKGLSAKASTSGSHPGGSGS
jgi:hypothetical protein